MKLSTADKNILNALIKMNKHIYKLIYNMSIGYSTHILKAKLDAFIKKENELIDKLNVTNQKLPLILEYINITNINDKLLPSFSLYLDEAHYARMRIYAKIRYRLLKKSDEEKDLIRVNLINEQVSIMYNIFLDKISKNNKNISKNTFMQLISLMDASEVESEYLSLPKNTPLTINDYTRIYTDIITYKIIKYTKNHTDTALLFIHEPYKQTYNNAISDYFDGMISIVLSRLEFVIKNYDDFSDEIIYTYMLTYLKSIFIMSSKETRIELYKVIENKIIKDASFKKDIILKELNEFIEEVENYSMTINHYRIHPLENPPTLYLK